MAHAPTLDERMCAVERAREELEHLEQASEVFRELFGQDLLEVVQHEMLSVSPPRSWLEASAAQLALSTASRIDLGRHLTLSGPFAQVTQKALAEETEHVAAARAAICDLCELAEDAPRQAVHCLQRWREVGLGSLDAEDARAAYLALLDIEARSLGLCLETPPLMASCH